MPIDFRRGSVHFDSTRGIVQSEPGAVVFPSRVLRADVAIAGFDIFFTGADHSFHREAVLAKIESVQDRTVIFRVEFLLRDFSGEIDDPFEGDVHVLVIAEVDGERVRPGTAAVMTTRARPAE
jgi:hypothetical protein